MAVSIDVAQTGNSKRDEAATVIGRISPRAYVGISLQLGLVLLLLRQFQIEGAVFVRLAVFAFAGFAIHALLPLRHRLPFFAALSVAATAFVLGAVNAAWLVSIGLVLIGICHLPVSFLARGLLLTGAASLLALQRADVLASPWSAAIWPILGSMFMFRLIAYFYDLRHEKTPPGAARTLAYFFMLPNACFPLFPVVDFKTFRRNYFDLDAYRLYQRGIDWIVRGVIHLLLYRVIYYHLTLAPAEVNTPALLSQYLVTNFLLYLRVSGLFHLVVGVLHLFGFHLPETHDRYLLASSFTDFWRRINIYWKDFMQKVFYYPAVFRLKKLGTEKAIVVATLWVFLLTWFLHAYQWFWLRGTLLFVPQDILFWTVLGVLVVVNSLYEMRHGRTRTIGKAAWAWQTWLILAAKTYATFWFICILWSFWTAESVGQWTSLWGALAGTWTAAVLVYPGIVLAVILLGSIPQDKVETARTVAAANRAWARERAVTLVCLVALVVISIEDVNTRISSEVATFVHSLRSGRLSRLDTAKLERGYYESLMSVDRFNSQLWEVYSRKPANWLGGEGANLKHFVGGFGQVELIPSFAATTPYGTVSINRWGMRDQDYPAVPAPGTYRAAMLGASSTMGWGVGDGRTFEALVERRLNDELTGTPYRRFEILNFGVPGYYPPQQLAAFDKAQAMRPQTIFYVATGREQDRSAFYLAEVVRKRVEIPYPELREIVARSGAVPEMNETEATKALLPYGSQILSYTYSHIASKARAAGIRPVWIFLPQVRPGSWQEQTAGAIQLARDAGFVTIDMQDVYEGNDVEKVRLAEWDDHPNTFGHELVARRLYDELLAQRETIFSEMARNDLDDR
jgi:D-alanyl-lipoteichoic acid acyltransferase DltB (MBOAT superfamily)